MSSIDRHPMLRRQLQRLGIEASAGSAPTAAQWQAFLARVDLVYTETDRSRGVLERSLELSSREMGERLDEQRRSDEIRVLVRQQRLTSIFENVPTPLFALDERDRVSAVNPAAVAAYGPLHALLGRTLDDVLGADAIARSKIVTLSEDDDPLGSLVIVAELRELASTHAR